MLKIMVLLMSVNEKSRSGLKKMILVLKIFFYSPAWMIRTMEIASLSIPH